jgi:hypothetical protein
MQATWRYASSPIGRKVFMADEETGSIFDTEPDPAFEAQLDAEAEAEIDAGLGVPHERVRAWLLQLSKGDRVPPPVA